MHVLGINALFHEPAVAPITGGRVAAAAEEERFSRRERGERPVPHPVRELPEQPARRRPEQAGLAPSGPGAAACSYDPALEEAMPAPAGRLREHTGEDALMTAGGVVLNCLANTRSWRESGFRHVWVRPAARGAGAAVHLAGTARIQTVDRAEEPLVARMRDGFARRTGPPVAVGTSRNTAGRPMADARRDALERFGSAPVGLLVLGPFAVRRGRAFA
ncbi:carbamoyltransferase C-terminal domain-containing protein [Streptomyces sp. AF1A]|jgi:predicted NodU family carbamoyl transferase|uniref:carbamoyltransferase C-terminal domain-containing protein n=1 Tax=Streptomyces sp. AF1A TaxID=3394350 RepID=UPI0039BC2B2F